MRTRTTLAAAAVLAAALLGWLAASGRPVVAQDAPKEVHEPAKDLQKGCCDVTQ
jgi:hypothetical protein